MKRTALVWSLGSGNKSDTPVSHSLILLLQISLKLSVCYINTHLIRLKDRPINPSVVKCDVTVIHFYTFYL